MSFAAILSTALGAAVTLQGCGSGSGGHSPSPSPSPPSPASKLICPEKTSVYDVLGRHNLTGKTAIITGGDSGLGLEMTKALAKQGAHVIIAARNVKKAQAIAHTISEATSSPVQAYELDLSSLASVRNFVQSYENWWYRDGLDFLINNAGIDGNPANKTADGFPVLFETDYLGHFLLTELLLPHLRQVGQSRGDARVVSVSSGAHENACEAAGWGKDCFRDWTYLGPQGPPVVPKKNVTIHYRTGPVVTPSSPYGVGKWLQIQHMAELAVRESQHGIQAFSLTPGFANTSMTSGSIDVNNPKFKTFCEQQVHPDPSIPENPCPFSAAQGAAAIAFCTVGNATSGRYYSRTWACEERPVVMHGFADEMRPELYNRSLHWVGLGPPPSIDVARAEFV